MYDKEFDRQLDNVGLINFAKNLAYYHNLNNKLDQEVGDFLRSKVVNPKLYSNDLRHQYTSALYARNLGNKWAERLGDWNEALNANQSGRADTQIDQINNEIGRRYGEQYPNTPREELLERLMQDHSKNTAYRKSIMNTQK